MFVRTFKSFFRGRKKQPIVNAHKVPKARKRVVLGLELLEDRVTPANFTTGNLAVIDLAAASTNTTGSILELNPDHRQPGESRPDGRHPIDRDQRSAFQQLGDKQLPLPLQRRHTADD